MPQIKLSDIHIPDRLREETFGDIKELAESMAVDGQLQAILVETTDTERHPGVSEPYTLLDGHRRYLAVEQLQSSDRSPLSVDKGFILATARASVDDPIAALRLEYFANHYREDFSWKETASFYRQTHEILTQRGGKAWNVDLTASFLGVTPRTVYRYLELTDDPDILADPVVQAAKSFNAASRKVQIKKETRKRKARAELRDTREAELGITPADFYATAASMAAQGDCREWISNLADNSVDFCHWDPPYGGEQAGGAMTTLEEIDDSEEYAKELMTHMVPEIHRVLHPGSWFVVWFHQSHREWLRNLLIDSGFWVNPYECIWFKSDRVADGHEITRYLTNAYEPFFLCGIDDPEHRLVLPNSSPQNVFSFPLVRKAARRHLMHKPAELLSAILDICTLPGELVIDPSAGSFSIAEAAITSGRRFSGCELSEAYHLGGVETISRILREHGKAPTQSASEAIPDGTMSL